MWFLVVCSFLTGQFLADVNVPDLRNHGSNTPIENQEQLSFDRARLVTDMHAAYLEGDFEEVYVRFIDLAVFDEYEGNNNQSITDVFKLFREQEPFRKNWVYFLTTLAEIDAPAIHQFFSEIPLDDISFDELFLLLETREQALDKTNEKVWMDAFVQKLRVGQTTSDCAPSLPIDDPEQYRFVRARLVAELHEAYLRGDYLETYSRYADLAEFDEYEGGNAECIYDILAVFRDQEPFRKTWPNFVSSLAKKDFVLLRRFFAKVPLDEISLFELRLLFQTSNEFYADVYEEIWMIEFINKLKAANRADELQQLTQVERGAWAENLRERAREALNVLEQENAKIEE